MPRRNRIIISLLMVTVVGAVAFRELSEPPPDDRPAAVQVDEYLSGLNAGYFSGTVLVARDGEILLHEGYGMADDATNTAVTTDTVFLIGSVSKQFTAAAIMHLQQEGLLSVEDSIADYLPNVPADKANITIQHLLTHSAGLEENHAASDREPLGRDEAVRRILAQELQFEPGNDYLYTNSGYSLLAAIIEVTSGQSYQDYLQENLFAPAGMANTGFYDDPVQWEGQTVATGYWFSNVNDKPTEWGDYQWGIVGNGGVLSTTGDMYLWWQALQDGTILTPESVEQVFTPHVREGRGSPTFYGYGWSVEDTERGRIIRHDGAGLGGNATFTGYLQEDVIVIVLNNRIGCRLSVGDTCWGEVFPANVVESRILRILFRS